MPIRRDLSNDRDPVEVLCEDFSSRQRAGERPTIEEYVEAFPHLADDIRLLFPALLTLYQADPRSSDFQPKPASEAADSAAQGSPAHAQIGEFRILREIGRGGMGIVYEAEQPSLGRRVALKVLPDRGASGGSRRARFAREARAVARLHHTSIVPVYNVGADGDVLYYTMQYIHGDSLDNIISVLSRNLASGEVAQPQKAAATPHHAIRAESSGVAQKLAETMLSAPSLPRAVNDQSETLVGQIPLSVQNESAPENPTPLSDEPEKATVGLRRNETSPPSTKLSSAQKREVHEFFLNVARIGVQAADALEYAHLQGVLHRDIKPGNLLMDQHGRVWLTDFGLARLTDEEALTETGDIIGTLRYMAPEVFSGLHDGRNDIYSLGLTLYELVALQPAFPENERHQLLKKVMAGEVVPLRTARPDAPQDLATVIEKAISADPAIRYQTAGDLRDDLRRFLDDRPIHARRLTITERLTRWRRREPRLALAILAALCAVLIGTAGITWNWLDARAARDAAKQAAIEERRQKLSAIEARNSATAAREREAASRREAEVARDTAIRIQYFAEMNQAAQTLLEDPKSTVVERILQSWRESRLRNDPRGWEWHWLNSDTRYERHLLHAHFADVRAVAFQPSGHLLASCGYSDSVVLWNTLTGRYLGGFPSYNGVVLAWKPDGSMLCCGSWQGVLVLYDTGSGRVDLIPGNGNITALNWSPDGSRLAVGRDAALEVYSTDHWTRLNSWPLRGVRLARFSPDGQKLAVVQGDIVLMFDGQLMPLGELKGHAGQISGLAWLKSGEVVTAAADGQLKTWSGEPPKEVRSVPCEDARHAVGWKLSPDESEIALVTSDRKIGILDPGTGSQKLQWRMGGEVTGGFPDCLSWSSDGKYLSAAFVGWNAPVPVWAPDELRDSTATQRQSPAEGTHRIPVAWSPDARMIASGTQTVSLWNPDGPELITQLAETDVKFRDICFSPDGKLLAAAGEGPLRVWDIESRKELWRTALLPCQKLAHSVAFSADGKLLAAMPESESTLMYFLDPLTGATLETSPVNVPYLSYLDWHPHLPILACMNRYDLDIRQPGHGNPLVTLPGDMLGDAMARFCRDGRRIACSRLDGQIELFDVSDLAALVQTSQPAANPGELSRDAALVKSLGFLAGHTDLVVSMDWSADGKRVASCDRTGNLIVWDPDVQRSIISLRGFARGCRWSPIDPVLACATSDSQIRLLDARYSLGLEGDLHRSKAELSEWTGSAAPDDVALMARAGRWNQIEALAGTGVIQPAWWLMNQNQATTSEIDSSTDAANLQSSEDQLPAWLRALNEHDYWYSPVDPSNGSIPLTSTDSVYCSPVYSSVDRDAALIASTSEGIEEIVVNETPLRFSLAAPHSWSYMTIRLRKGWNKVCFRALGLRERASPIASIRLSLDQPEIALAKEQDLVAELELQGQIRAAQERRENMVRLRNQLLRNPVPESLLFFGSSFARRKQPDWSELIFQTTHALETQPDDPNLLDQRARAFEQTGQLAEAESDLSRLISLQPGLSTHFRRRAELRLRQQKWHAALQDLDRSFSGDQQNSTDDVWIRLRAVFHLESAEEFQVRLRAAIQSTPKLQDVVKRVRELTEAISHLPEIQESLRTVALDAMRSRMSPDSSDDEVECFARFAAETVSSRPTIAQILAGTALMSPRARLLLAFDAQVNADVVRQVLGDQIPPFVEAADKLFERQAWKEARACYRYVEPTGVLSVQQKSRLADCCWKVGEFDEAERLWAEILQSDPNHSGCLRSRGEMRILSTRNPQGGVDDISKLLQPNPDDLPLLVIRGLGLQQLGKELDMHADFERAAGSAILRERYVSIQARLERVIRLGGWARANLMTESFDPKLNRWDETRDIAIVRLLNNDIDSARKLILEMLSKKPDPDSNGSRWAIFMLMCVPDMINSSNEKLLREWATRTSAERPEWPDHLTACIEHRLGNYREAERLFRLHKLISPFDFMAAMTALQLSRTEDAATLLSRGSKAMLDEQLAQPHLAIPSTSYWQDWAVKLLLQKEATMSAREM